MFNRAEVIDKNFTRRVTSLELPETTNNLNPRRVGISREGLVELFESQILSRHMDIRARELKQSNDSYYTIGSSGHEGNAVIGKAFRYTDMAFLHYRSGAFFVQRSKQLPESTPTYDMMLSLMSATSEPIAGGRHKVFGSKPLFIPPQTSTIASHLPKAVGAALSIPRAQTLGIKAEMPKNSVAICSFGDASANHSTALGAINTAAWIANRKVPLPLVFICEDNGIGISVPTTPNWIEQNFAQKPEYKYLQFDGRDMLDGFLKSQQAADYCRHFKKPVFLHMKTVRLLGHAGSDIESLYRSMKDVEDCEAQDPLLYSAGLLLRHRALSSEDIIKIYEDTRKRVHHVSQYAVTLPRLDDSVKVAQSITQCDQIKTAPPQSSDDERKAIFEKDFNQLKTPQTMAKLINWGLVDTMLRYKNALIFGEDVAHKGGVYHVTDKLTQRFHQKRVFNSVLDEQSILGTAIGLAHNGFLPIPEIQFLAYVHNAEDQIRGEAATLPFFSKGQFTNPMVVRIAGLAYQKGFGGHFHNDNSLSVFRDIPGLVLACPSNGADAVTMMRTACRMAVEEGRVTVFIEPIALYMTKDLFTPGDKLWSFQYPELSEETPCGQTRTYGQGKDLVIVTYGNGVYHSLRARKILEDKLKIKIRIIDLRWLAPIDYKKLADDVGDAKKILIVDECRKTGSHSEEIVSRLVEELVPLPPIKVLAADDCFIPLGPAAAKGLPDQDKIVALVEKWMESHK